MVAASDLTPESLTTRIIAELQEHPEARVLLLRALLTDEFLAMPARMIRVEEDIAELKTDVSQLKTDVAELKTDVAELKIDVGDLKTNVARINIDVGDLKGTNLEIKSARRIQSIITQRLGLRRPIIVHSLNSPMSGNDLEMLQDAEERGIIAPHSDTEALETDVILRAQRRSDHEPVWIAVEISNTIDQHDIARAQERSSILAGAYDQDALGVVAGIEMRPQEQEMADSLGVVVVLL
jgi:archaellum component FlaC